MSNQLVPTNGNQLSPYGARQDLNELAERLQMIMPGGRKLEKLEAVALAQISLAHGLDPSNGEAWMIPGSGVMVGIKGLRKAARRQAASENSSWWTEFRRVEPSTHQAAAIAVVYECLLRDTTTTQAWAKSINAMTSAGVPYQEAIKALGPSPLVVGVGIATPDERSKMNINARARKRAEADALKQRYDVSFANAEFSAEDGDNEGAHDMPITPTTFRANVVDATYTETRPAATTPAPETPAPAPQPETPTPTNGNGSRPYSPDQVAEKLKALADTFIKGNWTLKPVTRNMVPVNLEACFAGDPKSTDMRHTVLFWLFDAASTKDLTDAQCYALSKWLDAQPDSGGAWMPNGFSIKEANAIYAEALKAQGQMELPLEGEAVEAPTDPEWEPPFN